MCRLFDRSLKSSAELQMATAMSVMNRELVIPGGYVIELLERGLRDIRQLSDADRRRFTSPTTKSPTGTGSTLHACTTLLPPTDRTGEGTIKCTICSCVRPGRRCFGGRQCSAAG